MVRRLTALTAAVLMLATSIGSACACVSTAHHSPADNGPFGHTVQANHTVQPSQSAHADHLAQSSQAEHSAHAEQGQDHEERRPSESTCTHDCLSYAKLEEAAPAKTQTFAGATVFAGILAPAAPVTAFAGKHDPGPQALHATSDPPPRATPVSLHITLLV